MHVSPSIPVSRHGLSHFLTDLIKLAHNQNSFHWEMLGQMFVILINRLPRQPLISL